MTHTEAAVRTTLTFVSEHKLEAERPRITDPIVLTFRPMGFASHIGLLKQVEAFRVQTGQVSAEIPSVYAVESLETRRATMDDGTDTVFLLTARNDDLEQTYLFLEARIDAAGHLLQDQAWLSLRTSGDVHGIGGTA